MKVNTNTNTGTNNSENNTNFESYTGLTRAKIVAINPSLKDLEKIGVKLTNEPEYRTVINGDNKYIVSFWLKSEDVDKMFKLDYILDKSIVKNRDNTKTKMIDQYGRTAWTTDTQTLSDVNKEYFDTVNCRPCRTREEELNLFIRAYNSLKSKEAGTVNLEAVFQNPKNIVKDLTDSATGIYSPDVNNVWIFVMAQIVEKDGRRMFYQRIMNNKFYNGGMKLNDVKKWFKSFVDKNGSYIKDYFESVDMIKAIDKDQFGPIEVTDVKTNTNTSNLSGAPEGDDLPF